LITVLRVSSYEGCWHECASWLVGWLVGWLIGWLHGWGVGCQSVGWLWFISSLVGWSVGCSVGWLVVRLAICFVFVLFIDLISLVTRFFHLQAVEWSRLLRISLISM